MSFIRGTTRGGAPWTPRFLQQIDAQKCIGCGRCFKVCGREVLEPVALTDEDEAERMVMQLAKPENCIGCESCAKVCTRKCQVHAPLPLPA
ncbi:MAG: ferredoxin III, nif-specific [Thermaerobacter sp.]|nr:ferredoxin III, nif-specific [Thermaerobacter sp.]